MRAIPLIQTEKCVFNSCMELNQNCSKNEGARVITKFTKNNHCGIDLGPITLKHELV